MKRGTGGEPIPQELKGLKGVKQSVCIIPELPIQYLPK